MRDIHHEIETVSVWLRDHPHADKEARWDMIARLRDLNDKLNAHKVKIEQGLKLLNEGKSPLFMSQHEKYIESHRIYIDANDDLL